MVEVCECVRTRTTIFHSHFWAAMPNRANRITIFIIVRQASESALAFVCASHVKRIDKTNYSVFCFRAWALLSSDVDNNNFASALLQSTRQTRARTVISLVFVPFAFFHFSMPPALRCMRVCACPLSCLSMLAEHFDCDCRNIGRKVYQLHCMGACWSVVQLHSNQTCSNGDIQNGCMGFAELNE